MTCCSITFINRVSLFAICVFFAQSVCAEEPVDFNRDIRPLISSNCLACHGPDEEERAADLRLDTQEGSREDLGGYAAVEPGNPKDSEMIVRLMSDDEDMRMPPEGKGKRFTSEEIDLVKRWIREGGSYAKHWSYEKPTQPTVPKFDGSDFAKGNPIDAFVLRKLIAEKLKPSPQADRLTLARRVSIDLTGLPPTWDEAMAFVNDDRSDAYDRYVDSLLNKPAFGERWARVWLDLARYADSAGYADDPPRTIWPYRDWVIRAFNENKPFDQFTIEQIAGDLLENPTNAQLTATAFNRNTLTNNEGGTNDEEFRNVAVVDRVNTTLETWMGTTIACAQCHTHKFDPITQHEYFQLFDFFNQTEDADRRDESPLVELWAESQLVQKADWESQVTKLEKTLQTETPELAAARKLWLESVGKESTWNSLALKEASGAKLNKQEGGWIKLQGDKPENATYTLKFATTDGKDSGEQVSALRLEVSPEQTENFVLTQVSATWAPRKSKPIEGRFVRIELPGQSKMIHLAEVQIFSEGKNIAIDSTATQSSTDYNGPAKLAIDGNTNGVHAQGSVTHTKVENDPWFEIDFGAVRPLDELVIWNRTDNDLESRLMGYQVQVLDKDRGVVWKDQPADVPKPNSTFSLSGIRSLRFSAALADFEQKGFPAQSVLTEKEDVSKGWAVGGKTGQPHELTLVLASPVSLGDGTLQISLRQNSAHKQHVLKAFRVQMTGDENASELARIPSDVRELVRKPERTDEENKRISEFHRTIANELAAPRNELAKLNKQLASLKPSSTVPVMKELTDSKQRVTKVQIRGNYKSTGDVVKRGTPAVFHPLPDDVPRNRLALAKWIVDEENPLTSRVIVNRFWEQLFGTGIVETNEEFGSQGELPSHPQLLDWLAVDFQSDWDIKRLLKALVTSSTYRQVSRTTPEMMESDPFNRLFARGPRFRVSAEMVRDQALFVSGLLSDKMYGRPVNPPQPTLGLSAAFGGATDWKTSAGEDKFRRGIYTTWRRSSPYPSMSTFDAPNREVCTSRRSRTNTPLQALVTLNDPVYIEAAQSLARNIVASSDSPEERVVFAMRTCLTRDPTDQETSQIIELYEAAAKKFSQQSEQAKQMAEMPLGKLPEGADPVELAAWTVVGNVLLNLDELFLKR